jgi:predicted transposase YbfD/YdcC
VECFNKLQGGLMMAAQENREFEIDVTDLLSHFESLEDPRSEVNLRHPLESVIMISIMAILAGAGGPTAIALWAKSKNEWLSQLMPLPHGVPKKDVYRRVLMAVDPQAFQACFNQWLQSHYDRVADEKGITRPLLNIDGKTLRRSHDRRNGLGALHSVSVWAGEFGMTLAQVACEEKSNEITAIPEVLKMVNVKDAIVTIDAMGTQKKIAKQIIDAGGDYVLALKGNQKGLHKEIVAYIDEQMLNDFEGIGARKIITREKGHGRDEQRIYVQMPVPKHLAGKENWKGLKTIGVVMLMTNCDGKETCATRAAAFRAGSI